MNGMPKDSRMSSALTRVVMQMARKDLEGARSLLDLRTLRPTLNRRDDTPSQLLWHGCYSDSGSSIVADC